jgi:hypothetical protein
MLAVDGSLAVAHGLIHANAELPFAAETSADVYVRTQFARAAGIDRHASERRVVRALELKIDAPADRRAAWRRTVQKRVRAFEQFHAFQRFGRHQLTRRDAVQTVERNVVASQRKAADHEGLREVAKTPKLLPRAT